MYAADINEGKALQRELMDLRCTIHSGTAGADRFGNDTVAYTGPLSFDSGDYVPCRSEPGVTPENQALANRIGKSELWTVTLPAYTPVSLGDAIAIETFSKALRVESVSDGGSFETARVCICSAVA